MINKLKRNLLNIIELMGVLILVLSLLQGCSLGKESFELSQYDGSSIKAFQRKTNTKLTEESTGVYNLDGILQLMAPKGKITSIALLQGDADYSLFGVKIGMNKTEAEPLVQKTFGKEISKKINSANNTAIFNYKDSKSELYVFYDVNTNNVVEISYYRNEEDKDSKQQGENNSGELIAMVGDFRIYYNEAMVYLKSVQENYESEYGKGIWATDIFGDGRDFGDYIKDEVLNQVTELKIIGDKAKELGITLAEDEQAEARALALKHYEGLSDKDIDRYLITKELLEQVYSDNLLAEKMFETLTINVNTEVSDYEAKQITVQHILIHSVDYDDKGNIIPLTAEEKEHANEKANSLLQQARVAENFHDLAEANSEAEVIEYTFGRGKGPAEYSVAFEQAAFTLLTGEISDLVATDYGWHIIYCVSDFNQDATTQIKESIIEERRNEMFAKLYAEWSLAYDVVINSEVWSEVGFEE